MLFAHTPSQVRELYYFSILFSLAQSLILIFEPVFLYQLAIPLPVIALYYALHYMLYAITLPWGGRAAARLGLERALAISTPLLVLYFLVLASLPGRPDWLWLALVLLTAHKLFYWPAYYADLARFGDGHHRGAELSWINLFTHGVGILGPLCGGIIATLFGFPVLFVITAVTALVAVVPLLTTMEHFRPTEFEYSAPWRIITDRRHWRLVVSTIGMGDQLVALVFWPIFLFVVLGSAATLGLWVSVATVAMTAFGFLIGRYTDTVPKRTVLKVMTPFMVLGNLLRPLALTTFSVAWIELVNRLAFAGVMIPWTARVYDDAKKTRVIAYVTAMEIVLAISKAAVAGVLVWVFTVFPPFTGFTAGFLLAAVLALLYAFL